MNIPTKVLRSTYITYEAYFHHQQLAKKFYKCTKGKKAQEEPEAKSSFKDDLMKWFFSMSLPERIKAVSIENKWFSSMVQHMYAKYKFDQKIRFQLKFDDITPEEICIQQYLGPSQMAQANEVNLESFFYFKNDRHISEDRSINENLFLKELRYFSLREPNDTLTLSTSLLENEDLFKYFLDHFSGDKAFLNYCSLDNVLKVYNWDFPDWFNPREFNSISEFIVAYIEQVLSIRFWFALEERKDRACKTIPIISFSLCEEPNFNELFENREKLISFLTSQYGECKDKLFSSSIDLKKLLNDMKHDPNLMSKVRKPKPENMKGYFYLLNKTKFELFEPPVDTDHETIEKIKKTYYDETEECFIDELIFCKIETLNSLDDFLNKKVFEVLHNIYTEKNASDLMNEELNSFKKSNEIKSKRKKKNENKKKLKSSENFKKEDSSPKSFKSEELSIDNHSVEENKQDEKIVKQTSADSLESFLSTLKEEEKSNQSNHVILTVKSFEKEASSVNSANSANSATEKLTPKINKATPHVEIRKMSWRKMAPTVTECTTASTIPTKISKEETINNDEQYVNLLVKSLLTNIINKEAEASEDKLKTSLSNTNNSTSDIITIQNNTLSVNKQSKYPKNSKNTIKKQKYPQPCYSNSSKLTQVKNKAKSNYQRDSKKLKTIKSKEFLQKEEVVKQETLEVEKETEFPATQNSKSFSSDLEHQECQIESINHEIIQHDNKRKMVDNFSQTDKGSKSLIETENVHSTTQDEEEKSSELPSTPKPSAAPDKLKKKKKNAQINNFRSDRENEKSLVSSYLPGLNINKAKPKHVDGPLELKKCSSEGYSFKDDKEKITKPEASNFSYTTNTSSYGQPKILPVSKSNQINKKPNNFSESSNWDLDEYQDMSEDSFSSYSKSHYKGGYGGYKRKYSNWNGYNGNKFNSDGNFLTTKQVNNRSLFTRNDFNYPQYGYPKEPPVYNNYYIFNSNVNINNVHNFEEKSANRPIPPPNMYFNCNFGPEMNYVYPTMLFPGPQVEDTSKDILNQIPSDLHPFIFHYRLHNDILQYSNSVTNLIENLKEIKIFVISYLESVIQKSLNLGVTIDLYGSFATDLSIESSDIDLTIKFTEERSEVEINGLIEKLHESFKTLEVFESVNPILTASVPVIKILVDPEKILDEEKMVLYDKFRSSEAFRNYPFDKEELLKIKVDLSFIELTRSKQPLQSTKCSLDWARKTLSSYPEIKPIIHVLKRYLQIKQLNSSFNGGLSSFSLFLLIVAYLKYPKIKTKINLGRILMEMLELYGKFFHYAQSIIDVNLVSPFVFSNDFLENFPVILDPITGLNVAKSSYRIVEVRESLSQAYDFLNRQKINFDKKDLPTTTNVVFDLMLKSNVSCI